MKTAEKLNCRRLDDSGFTRVDLLALLAALALLASIALPSLGRVSEKTTIAQCAANLQQYDMALQIYGNENQDNLPSSIIGSGFWAWDTAAYVVTFVTNTGVKWNALYCPGTSPRFTEQDNLSLFNFDPGVFCVLGYVGAIPANSAMTTSPYSTNVNATLTIQRVAYSNQFLPVHPASRALVADATLTESGSSSVYAAMLTYDWVEIEGGYAKPHLSAHLNGTIPLGGNVGMLDGHVEWRNFKDMLPRASSGVYFYW
jgi:prepilin-type processing-associated H-X9-DG protein